MQTEEQELKIPSLEDFFNDAPKEQIEQQNDIFFEEEIQEQEITKTDEPELKVEPVVTSKPEPAIVANDFYSELIKDFIGEGDWIDGQIEIDGEPFVLSELQNVDKATFLKIKKGQQVAKEEREKGKYITTEDLDETDLKLIEIRKLKGDVRELLEFQSEVLHPLQGLDLEDLNVQRNIVYHKYKNKGVPDGAIRTIISELETNFKLDSEAAECVSEINEVYKQKVDAKLVAKKAEVAQEEENTKVYKKTLNESYKVYGLKDNTIKNLTEAATIKNKQGLTKTDELYHRAKADPDFYSKLNFFLNDPKGYEEFIGAGIKNKTALDTFIKISSTEKKSTSTQQKEEATGDWDDFFKIKQNN